jgi:hypothetical protein
MKKPIRHPILAALLLLILLRAGVLVILAAFTGGSILSALPTVALHLSFTVGLGCALLLVWHIATASMLRMAVTAIALTGLSFSLFLSLSDPILMAIIGERLTPSTLSHFAGPGLFLSDYFWKPVRAYWPAVSTAVALLLVYMVWVLRLFWRNGRNPNRTPLKLSGAVAGLVLGAGGYLLVDASDPALVQPIEVDYVRQVFGIDGSRLGMTESAATERIRAFAGLPEGAEWLDDRYPLVYRWRTVPPVPKSKPDVFIFVVESMRAETVRATNPDGASTVALPAIDAMAKDGVVIPNFLSNGFPSGPGFVGLSSGAWMHPVKRLDAAFQSTMFDRLGFRLRSQGYRTGLVTYDVRYDDKTSWVHSVFEDVIDCVALGLPASDEVSVSQFVNWVSSADIQGDRPLFGIFLTKEPHLPYLWPAEDGRWTFGPDLRDNYERSIRAVDQQLQKAFDFLRTRPRWKDTIVIVLGDHANFLNQGESTGLPVDDSVRTGAIIGGGSSLLGVPRIDLAPASQADIPSTVLALAGDFRPAMALGRNLLANQPNRPPRALAIRNGGVRLDHSNGSVMMPEGSPDRAIYYRDGNVTKDISPTIPSPETISEAVRIWAWMIENDRVWSNRFLE